MDLESKRQASEAIKDLMVHEKRSRLPLVLGILALVAVVAGGFYLYSLPPEKRPTLEDLKGRVMSLSNTILNAPIIKAPTPAAPNAPTPAQKTPSPSKPGDKSGLLSN